MSSASRIQKKVERIRKAILKETKRNVERIVRRRVEEEAIHLSSLSDHSLADLAAMGHPYARRHGADSGPHGDQFIHHQTIATGLAFVDMFKSSVEITDGGVTFVLRNEAPHWQYLRDGTSKMRPRPLHVELADRIRTDIVPEFAEAQKQALARLVKKFAAKQ